MRAIAIGIPFIRRKISGIIAAFNWGTSTPTKVWGTATTENWG